MHSRSGRVWLKAVMVSMWLMACPEPMPGTDAGTGGGAAQAGGRGGAGAAGGAATGGGSVLGGGITGGGSVAGGASGGTSGGVTSGGVAGGASGGGTSGGVTGGGVAGGASGGTSGGVTGGGVAGGASGGGTSGGVTGGGQATGGGATSGGTAGGAVDAGAPLLTVTPSAATTWFNGPQVVLTATLMNSTEPITWQLSGVGTLSATSGAATTYTPPVSGSFSSLAIAQASTPSGLFAQVMLTIGLTPTLTVTPATATATIGGGAVTLTATATHFPSTPTLTWSLLGAGTLSAATGPSVTWTPPASGSAGVSMVTVSAPGGFMALSTLSYASAPTLLLNRTSAAALASPQGLPLDLTATLSGSTSPITWTLTGPGSLSQSAGAVTQYRPPMTLSGFADATITATAGPLTATCSVRIYSVRLSWPPVFVSDAPVQVTATVSGSPTVGTWLLGGGSRGSLANPTGLSVDYVPPHDPALAGNAHLVFRTPEGDTRGTLVVDARRNRGLTIVAWGTVPVIVSTTGTVLSAAAAYVSTGANSSVTATRLMTGLTSVRIDGLALGARNSTVEVTPWGSARCSTESAMLDTLVVRCIDSSGTPVNAPFSFRVLQDRLAAGGSLLAYGVVPLAAPSATTMTLPPAEAWSLGGAVQVVNTVSGSFALSLGALPPGVTLGAVHLTPLLPRLNDQRCSVASVAGSTVNVRCVTAAGMDANVGFQFSVTGRGFVSEATIDSQVSLDAAPMGVGPVQASSAATAGALWAPAFFRYASGAYEVAAGSSNGVLGTLHRGLPPRIGHVSSRTASLSCVTGPTWSVACFDAMFNLVDTGVDLTFISRGRPSVANVTGFAFIDLAGASSTPSSSTAYSASAGAITSTRRGVGDYRVTFAGLGLTNATAMATAFGSARRCAVESVSNDDVDVRCYGPANQPLDTQFSVVTHEYAAPSTARVMAWARVEASGAAPTGAFASNPAGPISVVHSTPGNYTVTFSGLTVDELVNVQVAAQNSSRFCSVFVRSPPVVGVQCHDGAGPADSDFTVAVFANQPFTSLTQAVTNAEVLAFAFASDPTAASYAPFAPLSYNSGLEPIVATRSGPGAYAMRFPKLSFNSGVVQVTATDTANRCAVLSQLDDTVTVRCYAGSGLPADSRYLLSFLR